MTPQDPCIQSYFHPSVPNQPSPSPEYGDGFTTAEIDSVLSPRIPQDWSSPGDYEECQICDLVPGPRLITFRGRVVNISDPSRWVNLPRASKGCFKMTIRDDSGILTVSSLMDGNTGSRMFCASLITCAGQVMLFEIQILPSPRTTGNDLGDQNI